MTIEALLDPEHASKPRNKLIAQIFYDLGLIERYGSGIHRILDACRESGLSEPLFENFSGGFRIKFMMPEQVAEGEAEEGLPLNGALNGALNQRILIEIRNSPGMQRKTIVEILGVPDRTVDRYISELIAAGKIERRGSKKTGGYWEL